MQYTSAYSSYTNILVSSYVLSFTSDLGYKKILFILGHNYNFKIKLHSSFRDYQLY